MFAPLDRIFGFLDHQYHRRQSQQLIGILLPQVPATCRCLRPCGRRKRDRGKAKVELARRFINYGTLRAQQGTCQQGRHFLPASRPAILRLHDRTGTFRQIRNATHAGFLFTLAAVRYSVGSKAGRIQTHRHILVAPQFCCAATGATRGAALGQRD